MCNTIHQWRSENADPPLLTSNNPEDHGAGYLAYIRYLNQARGYTIPAASHTTHPYEGRPPRQDSGIDVQQHTSTATSYAPSTSFSSVPSSDASYNPDGAVGLQGYADASQHGKDYYGFQPDPSVPSYTAGSAQVPLSHSSQPLSSAYSSYSVDPRTGLPQDAGGSSYCGGSYTYSTSHL